MPPPAPAVLIPAVLILGGTAEASALARALVGADWLRPVLSLAGRTRAPMAPPIAHRIGGFGGIDGLVGYLRQHRIAALVDATHPFAAQMTRHAVAAAALAGVPLLRLERPPWLAAEGDRWTMVPDVPAAARALGGVPRRVFLTIGQTELAPFRVAAAMHDYLVRSVDPPCAALLPPRATVIAARGPFAEADEVRLLRAHRIDILVTKNSGGAATAGKLAAARRLGVPVVMVARPAAAGLQAAVGAATVPDAAGALDWLHGVLPRGV